MARILMLCVTVSPTWRSFLTAVRIDLVTRRACLFTRCTQIAGCCSLIALTDFGSLTCLLDRKLSNGRSSHVTCQTCSSKPHLCVMAKCTRKHANYSCHLLRTCCGLSYRQTRRPTALVIRGGCGLRLPTLPASPS